MGRGQGSGPSGPRTVEEIPGFVGPEALTRDLVGGRTTTSEGTDLGLTLGEPTLGAPLATTDGSPQSSKHLQGSVLPTPPRDVTDRVSSTGL